MVLYKITNNCCGDFWKKLPNNYALKYISLPGNYNNADVSANEGNNFKARPIKHWRKQYEQNTNKQSFSKKTIMQDYNIPGGYIVKNYSIEGNWKSPPCECSGNLLGYPNMHPNVNNSICTKKDPAGCKIDNTETIAKKRTRSSYTVRDNRYNRSSGYISYDKYLYSRYKTESRIYSPYDNDVCHKNRCDYVIPITNSNKKKVLGIDKPVSSGARLLRLKVDTVNKNAYLMGSAYGSQSTNALAYNGNPEAPFINKSKVNAGGFWKPHDCRYPIDKSLYYIYLTNKKRYKGQIVCN